MTVAVPPDGRARRKNDDDVEDRGERGSRRVPHRVGGRRWRVEWGPDEVTGSPAVGGGESSVGPVYRDSVDGGPASEYGTHRGRPSPARSPRRPLGERLQGALRCLCAPVGRIDAGEGDECARGGVPISAMLDLGRSTAAYDARDRRRRRAPADPASRRPGSRPRSNT